MGHFCGSVSLVISLMLFMNIMLLDKIFIGGATMVLEMTRYQEVKVTVET